MAYVYEAAGLLDAPLELVLMLELTPLGGDEAENDHLVPGHEAQRFEAAGARAVVLEEEAIHFCLFDFGRKGRMMLGDVGAAIFIRVWAIWRSR